AFGAGGGGADITAAAERRPNRGGQPGEVVPALRASAAAGAPLPDAAADGEGAQRQGEGRPHDRGVEEGVDGEAGGDRRERRPPAVGTAAVPVRAGEHP